MKELEAARANTYRERIALEAKRDQLPALPADADELVVAERDEALETFTPAILRLKRAEKAARHAYLTTRKQYQEQQRRIAKPKVLAAVKRLHGKLIEGQAACRAVLEAQHLAANEGARWVECGPMGSEADQALLFRPLLNGKLDAWERYMKREGWL
jgi:hypothetical protein